MTYAAREESVHGGNPVEGYQFQSGGTYWRYTSVDHDLTINSNVYTALLISRGGYVHGADPAKADLVITVARDNDVAALFVAGSLGGPMILTLFREHEDDGEFVTYWKGRVMSVSFAGSLATLRCESIFTSIKRQGLRRKYQFLCPHVLYRGKCALGIAAVDFKFDGTVSVVDGTTVTVPGLDGQADGFYVGGYLKWGGYQYRTVLGHAGNVIELDRAIVGLVVDEAVSVYAGCDHTRTHCADKFDNLVNFGGWPWISGKNPFSGLGNSLL